MTKIFITTKRPVTMETRVASIQQLLVFLLLTLRFAVAAAVHEITSSGVGVDVDLSTIGDFAESAAMYKLEGRVVSVNDLVDDPVTSTSSWFTSTRVLVNGGERLAFLREDGSFVVSGLPSGSYVVEVVNPDYLYEPVRVEITSKGKIRARRLNLIQVSSVVQLPYPLRFKVKAPFKYFQVREQWRVTDFLFSPMVLMMVVPLLLIMVMPKLMNAADPDTQREMQQSLQGSNIEWPDMSEAITSWLGGGKKAAAPQKAIKANKKRQQ